jgi:hypothetical protein
MPTSGPEGASAPGTDADLTDALVVVTVLPQILKTASSPEETDKTVVD